MLKRIRNNRPKAVRCLLLLALAGPALALVPGKPLSEYSHRVWLTQDGLPQNTIHTVFQAKDRYLWFGTEEGLVKFDGFQFKTYNTANTPEIKMNGVRVVLQDRQGGIWLGTNGGGVTYFKDGQFHLLTALQKWTNPGAQTLYVQSMYEDHEGALWIGTESGLFRYRNGALVSFTSNDGLANMHVWAITEDSRHRLWVGTGGGGLFLWNQGRFVPVRGKLASQYITVLVTDHDVLWIGTLGAGVWRYSNENFEIYTKQDGLDKETIRAIHRDRNGYLWVGTDHAGLRRISPSGTVESFRNKDGLSSDEVSAIVEDDEGNLWVGTNGAGLNRLKDAPFRTYSMPEGLSGGVIRAIVQDRHGDLWIATQTTGLNRMHNGKFTGYGVRQGLSSNFLRALYVDADDSLWIGAEGSGLNHLARDGSISAFTAKDGLASDFIRSVLRDKDGNLWVGTDGGGVSRFRDGKFTNFSVSDGLAGNVVSAMLQSRTGGLWLATNNGLSLFKNGKFTNFTAKDGLSSNLLRCLYEDEDGVLWIGTRGGGLNRFQNGKFTVYNSELGLAEDVVFSITEDNDHYLWMSSNRGVFRTSKKQLNDFAAGRVPAITSVSFGTADGMRSEECNGAFQPSAWKTTDGRIWFPTINGVAVVDPSMLHSSPIVPRAVLDDVLADKKPVSLSALLDIPPGKGDLELHYSTVTFTSPEKIKFKYQLEGYEKEWIQAGTRRVAYYTNISPGTYTFRVMARASDGRWEESAATVEIHLKPHFHQTSYFVIGCALGLIGLAVFVYRLRLSRLRSQEQLLMKAVDLRTRELQQEILEHKRTAERLLEARRAAESASRVKGDFLANMSHEIRTPLNGVLGMTELALDTQLTDEQRDFLSTAYDSAQILLNVVNDILDFSKIEAGKLQVESLPVNLRELVESTAKCLALKARQKNLKLVYELDPDVPLLVKTDPTRLKQVLFNLLGNALKFTHQGRIILRVGCGSGSPETLEFSVEDTGIGIPQEKISAIFEAFSQADPSTTRQYGGTGLGLAISRRLVELMGGSMKLESTVGQGTKVSFVLPLTPVTPAQSAGNVAPQRPFSPEEKFPNLKVLLVEDNLVNQKLALKLLERAGFSVTVAEDGRQAFDLFCANIFDVILMDVQMPTLDGLTATIMIRQREKRFGSHTPIIAMTAHALESDRERCFAAGMDGYLSKPLNSQQLLKTVFDIVSAPSR